MGDTSKYGITLNCKFEKALAAPPVFARNASDEAISPPALSLKIATPSARNDKEERFATTKWKANVSLSIWASAMSVSNV